MSIAGLSPGPDKVFNKTYRHRNHSDELDVFEASRYFAGESAGGVTQKIMLKQHKIDDVYAQKIMIKEEKQSSSDYWNRVSTGGGGGGGVRRKSLDIPSMRNNHHHHHSLFSSFQHHQNHHLTAADQKQMPKDKKHKQPSSPGGRLASFLNSLFSQSSKKKKPKSTASTHDPDLDDSPGGGRRKRRSSISHVGTTYTTNPNQNSTVYSVSSKNSGFRTPPAAYAQTPIKIVHRSFSDHKETVASSREKKNPDPSGPDHEKFRLRDEKNKNFTTTTINRYSNSDRNKPDVDDGAESDSSSDLFELQNYDLGDYSSGLPVYETTHLDNIKRGAPISVHRP